MFSIWYTLLIMEPSEQTNSLVVLFHLTDPHLLFLTLPGQKFLDSNKSFSLFLVPLLGFCPPSIGVLTPWCSTGCWLGWIKIVLPPTVEAKASWRSSHQGSARGCWRGTRAHCCFSHGEGSVSDISRGTGLERWYGFLGMGKWPQGATREHTGTPGATSG